MAGAIQARKERRRQRGLIETSYARGKEQLDKGQADQRQAQGEGLLARGLGQGGTVNDPGAVGPAGLPSVGGAHDLGGQQVLDQRREQGLVQQGLLQEKQNALGAANAAGTQGIVNAVAGGISTGVSAYQGLTAIQGLRGSGGAGGSGASLAGEPWGGIDPVNPFGPGSAWSTGDFNVFHRGTG